MKGVREALAGLLVLGLLAGCASSAGSPEPGASAAITRGPEPAPPAGTAACPAATGTATGTAAGAATDDGLPALTLPCVTGPGEVDLAALADGTPLVLNLWASWCEPCVTEMPWLADLDARTGDRLTVLGVLSDDPTDSWPSVLEQTGARYASVRDDEGTLLHQFVGSPGPPVTLFVRGDGTLAGRHIGIFTGQADLDDTVREMLGVSL